MKTRLGLALAAAFLSNAALAQTAQQPSNPLQPRVVRPAPAQVAPPAEAAPTAPVRRTRATPAQAAPTQETTAPRPARQRSPAQLANDDRMRKCGAEWRANKAALSARGQTWRVFNVECRARLKAAGQ